MLKQLYIDSSNLIIGTLQVSLQGSSVPVQVIAYKFYNFPSTQFMPVIGSFLLTLLMTVKMGRFACMQVAFPSAKPSVLIVIRTVLKHLRNTLVLDT